jgi:hypothetical protein
MLRTEVKLYSSLFVQMAQSMRDQGKALPPDYDPQAPLIQVSQEVTELSTAPLDDAAFRMPEGYQTTPLTEMMTALTQPKLLD